jgi:hypothetical protein
VLPSLTTLVIRRWNLQKAIRSQGWALMSGISALIKEVLECHLSLALCGNMVMKVPSVNQKAASHQMPNQLTP